MTTFWNGTGTAVTSAKGGATFMHVLRAAAITGVAWSCISPATGEDYPEPPDVIQLGEDDGTAFLKLLADNGYQGAQSVLLVTMAYTDTEGEKLIAFKFGGSPVSKTEPFPKGSFQIPEVEPGSDFKAIVLYIGSPASGKSCNNSGGTPYCRF